MGTFKLDLDRRHEAAAKSTKGIEGKVNGAATVVAYACFTVLHASLWNDIDGLRERVVRHICV